MSIRVGGNNFPIETFGDLSQTPSPTDLTQVTQSEEFNGDRNLPNDLRSRMLRAQVEQKFAQTQEDKFWP